MGKHQKRHIQGRKGEMFAERLQGVDREQVLVVAIDVAKFNPKALLCDFFGRVLEDPFVVAMTEPGFTDLQARIERWGRELPAVHVLVGLESTGHYHEPLVRFLRGLGYEVIILNPGTTALTRSARRQAVKTDIEDLGIIAHCIIQQQWMQTTLPEGLFAELTTVTRARRQEVQRRTMTLLEIRRLLDHIWPTLQGFIQVAEDVSTRSLRTLLRHHPTPQAVVALGLDGLFEFARDHRCRWREVELRRVFEAAQPAPKQPLTDIRHELQLLQYRLDDLDIP